MFINTGNSNFSVSYFSDCGFKLIIFNILIRSKRFLYETEIYRIVSPAEGFIGVDSKD